MAGISKAEEKTNCCDCTDNPCKPCGDCACCQGGGCCACCDCCVSTTGPCEPDCSCCADGDCCPCCKSCKKLLFQPSSASGDSFALPPLCRHVGHVDGLSPKEKVWQGYAAGHVAPVEHLKAVGGLAVGEFVGDSVGQKHPAFLRPGADDPVAVLVCAAGPEDTAAGLL